MPSDTPEWGRTLSEYLTERMDDNEASQGMSIEFTTEATTKALTEVGELKVLFQRQSNQITDILYQLNHPRRENKQLQEKVNGLENQSRRDNLIFTSLKEQSRDRDNDCSRKVFDLLRYKTNIPPDVLDHIRIVRCHRLGAYIPGKACPIIIKLHFFPDKQFILSKASNLKGSGIFINEDYSALTQSRHKVLYPLVKAARQNPEYKECVHLSVDKLILQGQTLHSRHHP